MHIVKTGVPNKYIGTCARMSVSLCLKKTRQSHHQCASKRSGSVGNRGELAPLNQAAVRKAQKAASVAQNCAKHKIVQSIKSFKAQNCVKHKIVQSTKLCKEQNCAKHKSAQSTNLCKAQSTMGCTKWLPAPPKWSARCINRVSSAAHPPVNTPSQSQFMSFPPLLRSWPHHSIKLFNWLLHFEHSY